MAVTLARPISFASAIWGWSGSGHHMTVLVSFLEKVSIHRNNAEEWAEKRVAMTLKGAKTY